MLLWLVRVCSWLVPSEVEVEVERVALVLLWVKSVVASTVVAFLLVG